MRNLTSSLWIFALLMCLSPALGQDGKQDEPFTFEDLRDSLSDLKKQEDEKEKDRRDGIIRKNQHETLEIYRGVLGNKKGDLENVQRRLQVNRQLEAKYAKQLDAARTELAMLRSRYVNRTLALKRSLEEGKISQDAYDRLLQEDGEKFRNREAELLDDINFSSAELETARALVKDLELKVELMSYDPFEPEGDFVEKAPKRPRLGVADRIRAKLRTVARFRDLSVVDTLK